MALGIIFGPDRDDERRAKALIQMTVHRSNLNQVPGMEIAAYRQVRSGKKEQPEAHWRCGQATLAKFPLEGYDDEDDFGF